jgi:membrane-bound metal-dependent hydrolase YbcI (DUF457 family)
MADFKTHISVGALASGLASTAMLVAHTADSREVIFYMTMGTLGSILPDVDSDSSRPVQICFTLAATIFAFFMVFRHGADLSVSEVFLMGVAAFLIMRYAVFNIFTQFTVHRGIMHSIPAAAFFGLLSVNIGYRFFHLTSLDAWTAGAFIAFGFLVHLLLDEIFSVNLFGVSLKKSFGTAMKLRDPNNLTRTLLMYLAVILLFWQSPNYKPVLDKVLNEKKYRHIQILPDGDWFKNVIQPLTNDD